VVVIDAPTSYAQYTLKAVAEVTNKPITHIVYSHAAIDPRRIMTALPEEAMHSSAAGTVNELQIISRRAC
jgi:hypothetical protein